MNEIFQSDKVNADIEAVLAFGRPRSRLKRWRMPTFLVFIVAAVAVAYILFDIDGGRNGVSYVTAPVTKGDLTITVTATGTVQPTNKVEVSSELSGIVRSVLVDYNSKVRRGAKLAVLDTDKLKAVVDSSRAKLAAAKATVSAMEATLLEKKLERARQQTLVTKKVGAVQQLETAGAGYDRALAELQGAKADVEAAAADLAMNETNLQKAEIVSPITGVVLSRNVESGQTVASSLQTPILFAIAEDLTKMEAQVNVDEADIGNVSEGQAATFSVDAYPDKKFTAIVRQLRFGSEVVQGVVTYKAALTADNSKLLLRPGMTATAEIVAQHVADAVMIPNEALRFTPPYKANADSRNFLQKLIPGPPPRLGRPATQQASSGPDRKLWVLANGTPKEVSVIVGPSDGQHTQILAGDIVLGQDVIVDAETSR